MKAQTEVAPSWRVDAPTALIVATPDRMDGHAHSIAGYGARLVGQVAPEAVADRLAQQVALDLILFDTRGVAPDLASDVALDLAHWSGELGCRLVATLTPDTLDAVASPLLMSAATLLCGATPAEEAAAVLAALPPPATRLHDAAREREAERLRLLNEEVARLAEVLSQLAAERISDDRTVGVRDHGLAFRSEAPAEPEADPRTVRATIRARRLRDQFFASELFADPAWDMLLDLYAARLERRPVSVSSLCIAAAVPPTTALRWIGTMQDAGLFGREADPSDKRRAHLTLTRRAADGMRGYFGAAAKAGLAVG